MIPIVLVVASSTTTFLPFDVLFDELQGVGARAREGLQRQVLCPTSSFQVSEDNVGPRYLKFNNEHRVHTSKDLTNGRSTPQAPVHQHILTCNTPG